MFLSNFNLGEYLSIFDSDKSAFSGRQYIWMEGWELLKDNPWGVGYKFTLYSHKTNELHNFVLTLYMYYGVITASFILIILNKTVFNLFDKISDRVIKDSIVGFACFLLIGLTESSLFSMYISFFPMFIAYNRYNQLKLLDINSKLKK